MPLQIRSEVEPFTLNNYRPDGTSGKMSASGAGFKSRADQIFHAMLRLATAAILKCGPWRKAAQKGTTRDTRKGIA